MKQHILNTIIQGLETDPYRVVRINNIDSGSIICNNYGSKEMIDEAGGVNEYFNQLYRSGIKNISIVRRKRNGKNAFKATGEPIETFSFTASGQLNNDTMVQPVKNIPVTTADNSGQLFGSMQGLFGNVPPSDLIYKVQRYNEILQENSELRAENKELKKANEDLERQKMKDEYDINRKAGNKELFDTIAQIAGPALSGLLNKGAAGAETAGLNSPQALSPIKQQLFDLMSGNNDNIANYLLQTLHLMLTDTEFGNELMKLLQQHQKTASNEQ